MRASYIPNKILKWYDNNKRTLPWRKKVSTKNREYFTLVSEFMLQQTQVKTVIPYFLRFVNKIKTLEQLSKTHEKKILKYWEGLGYYRRARNLLATSKILVKEKNSILPKTLIDIKKLPGIGDYTGNALLGLVHNEPRIAVDGNVKKCKCKPYLKMTGDGGDGSSCAKPSCGTGENAGKPVTTEAGGCDPCATGMIASDPVDGIVKSCKCKPKFAPKVGGVGCE